MKECNTCKSELKNNVCETCINNVKLIINEDGFVWLDVSDNALGIWHTSTVELYLALDGGENQGLVESEAELKEYTARS